MVHIVDADRMRMDLNHSSNTKKLDRLTWIAGVSVGIALVLQVIFIAALNRILTMITFR